MIRVAVEQPFVLGAQALSAGVVIALPQPLALALAKQGQVRVLDAPSAEPAESAEQASLPPAPVKRRRP